MGALRICIDGLPGEDSEVNIELCHGIRNVGIGLMRYSAEPGCRSHVQRYVKIRNNN